MSLRAANSSTDFNPIVVVGDVTVDWAFRAPAVETSEPLETTYEWEQRHSAQMLAMPGGAALVTEVIAAAAHHLKTDRTVCVTGPSLPRDSLINPFDETLTRTYTTWQPYPVEPGNPALVWRIHRFHGIQLSKQTSTISHEFPEQFRCLVIDDANLGFRDDEISWSSILDSNPGPSHVILKMSNPLASGPLWERLVERFADRLTVYCSTGDLRKEYAPIGQALSWERTAQDVTNAVRARDELLKSARVIVSVGMSGAVIVERDGTAVLIHDPLNQEGDWESQRPGTPMGLGTCVAAGLAIQAHDNPVHTDWALAVSRSLEAARVLHNARQVRLKEDAPFPFAEIAAALTSGDSSTFRSLPINDSPDWTILESTYGDEIGILAERLATQHNSTDGIELPLERIGVWSSIDRTEIESMRSVRNIIGEYLHQANPPRPLSLAVFGPPGSGKSFAIKQMARQLGAGEIRIDVLEFNLSQFQSKDDLPNALQHVRDSAVEGSLALVFWDEFDTPLNGQEMGWLAQFLAPMQDGVYKERGVDRPIGPAIFVFAGGTHPSMDQFKMRAVELPVAKATDFLSRLRGYVDILGPNASGEEDRTWALRRALLLRALLTARAPAITRAGRVDIDPGVLRAFLGVSTYLHGARSMESIIDMSALTGKLRYERSALPARHQLALHVDPDEFLWLVHQGS